MTYPQRVITYTVIVKGGRSASQDLERVVYWAEDALCGVLNTEGYDVVIPKNPTITDLRGKSISFKE